MAASLPSLSVTETMGYRASVVEPGSHTLLDSGGCLDAANHQRSATSTARDLIPGGYPCRRNAAPATCRPLSQSTNDHERTPTHQQV